MHFYACCFVDAFYVVFIFLSLLCIVLLYVLFVDCRIVVMYRRARSQQRQVQVSGGRDGLHLRRTGRILNIIITTSALALSLSHSVRIRLHWTTSPQHFDSFVYCPFNLQMNEFFVRSWKSLFILFSAKYVYYMRVVRRLLGKVTFRF